MSVVGNKNFASKGKIILYAGSHFDSRLTHPFKLHCGRSRNRNALSWTVIKTKVRLEFTRLLVGLCSYGEWCGKESLN